MSRHLTRAVTATLFAMVLLLVVPSISLAQGRGRGRGRGPDLDKKCGKFVNCHDARDGRWDGRGPNRTRGIRIGDIFRHRRVHNRNDEIFSPRGRNRRVDRDGDGDFDRNDVLLGRRNRVDLDGDGDFDRNDVRLRQRARRHGRWQ